MSIAVNWWAVVVAALASVVFGFLWYGVIFKNVYMKLVGMSPEQCMDSEKKKAMKKNSVIMFIGSLVMSWVLLYSIVYGASYNHVSGAIAGIMAGFWNWLGFIAPVSLGSVLWDGKSWKLWFFNNAYELISLLIMGYILTVWM